MNKIELKKSSLKPIICLMILAGLAMVVVLRPSPAQGSGEYRVFLPAIVSSNTNTPPPPPPTGVEGRFFFDTQYKTSNASIQVDAQGGMHLAYYYYEPAIDDRPTYGVYYYCPGDCDNDASWSGVAMGELVNEIQLQLTVTGQPRIIFRTPSQVRASGNDYLYAACD